MARSLIIAVLFLLFAHARAQTGGAVFMLPPLPSPATTPKLPFSHWQISLNVGPSIPEGHFGSLNRSDAQAGYARTGFVAELSTTYHFVPAIGLVLAYSRQDNSIGTPNGFIPTPSGNFAVHSHHWNINRLQAGIVFGQTLGSRGPILQVRALAGFLKTAVPGYDYSFSGTGSVQQTKGTNPDQSLPRAFSYQTDAGLQWPLSRQLRLMFNAGYAGSKSLVLDQEVYITGNMTVTGPVEIKKTYVTGTVYAQAGLGISF